MIFVFTVTGKILVNGEPCLTITSNADFLPKEFAMSKKQIEKLNIVEFLDNALVVEVNFNGKGIDCYDLAKLQEVLG